MGPLGFRAQLAHPGAMATLIKQYGDTDKTSLKADREVEGGRRGGENGTGEQRSDSTNETTKNMPNLTGTHQDSPELTQESPQIAYELAEPLFIQFRIHDPSQGGRARARARAGALSELLRLSVESNIVSRAHRASHRTHG